MNRFPRGFLNVKRSFSATTTSQNQTSGNNSLFLATGLIAALGIGAYFYNQPSKPAPMALNKDEFVSFKIQKVEDVTPNTKLYRFELPTKDHELGMIVSSSVLAKVQNPVQGEKPILRPYTPVTPDDTKGYFDLIIKIYEKGQFGQAIKKMSVGDEVAFKGPGKKYEYVPNEFASYSMIAGGSGITPMLQVARHILKNPQDKTRVNLIFGNVSEDDIILKKELDELQLAHPSQFRVSYIVDKPSKTWNGLKGYVTEDIVKKLIPGPEEKGRVLVCGPPPMMKAICGPKAKDFTQGELSGLLAKMGYKKEQVFKY